MARHGVWGMVIATMTVAAGGETDLEHPARLVEGLPTAALSERDTSRWMAGKALFERVFERGQGLGPRFNATSCVACHESPTKGGAGGLEHNVGGVRPDGTLALGYSWRGGRTASEPPKTLADIREGLATMEPEVRELALARLPPEQRKELLGSGHLAVGLQTPSLFGLGWLETVHETEILAREDPEDRDGDGVRGVARRIDTGGGREEIGRFGWRAQAPTMTDFVRVACGGELGLTVPADTRGFGIERDRDAVADPELAFHELEDLVFYCRDLAPPPRAGRADDPTVVRGEVLFEEVGCAACHVPSLQGRYGAVHAYTDLLLHRVNVAATDTRSAFDPSRVAGRHASRDVRRSAPQIAEEDIAFRTPPLWGISRTGPYLHHGGAETLEQAILAHAGEALRSRMAWRRLDPEQQEALLAFLADL